MKSRFVFFLYITFFVLSKNVWAGVMGDFLDGTHIPKTYSTLNEAEADVAHFQELDRQIANQEQALKPHYDNAKQNLEEITKKLERVRNLKRGVPALREALRDFREAKSLLDQIEAQMANLRDKKWDNYILTADAVSARERFRESQTQQQNKAL